MKVPIAFLDANVMYSRTLCDWIFMLRRELPGMFLVYSSADAIDEAIYRLRRAHPDADGSLTERKRQKLREFLDETVTEFPGNVPFSGADDHDRHIHAAATHVRAHYLVSDDRGFTTFASDDAVYEAHSADTFLCLVAENAPYAVQTVIVQQLAYWSKLPKSKNLANALRDANCPEFARRIDEALKALSEGRSVHAIFASAPRS